MAGAKPRRRAPAAKKTRITTKGTESVAPCPSSDRPPPKWPRRWRGIRRGARRPSRSSDREGRRQLRKRRAGHRRVSRRETPQRGRRTTKKCTEPVAPSSGFPTDCRRSGRRSESHQPRTLRTRCIAHTRAPRPDRQGGLRRRGRNLRSFLFTPDETAAPAACSRCEEREKRAGHEGPAARVRRAGNAFVHLPDEPSASA